jgi:sugar phosphate isomerase/epimerase
MDDDALHTLLDAEATPADQKALSVGLYHRGVIAFVVAVAAGLGSCMAAEPLLTRPPGMVSYTYREPFKTDIPGTLDAIRKLGVRDIEFSNLFGATAAVIRRLLDERGMTCSSYGVGYEALITSPDAVAADAKTLGARFVRVAWIPHQAPFTADHARTAAADFNRVGRVLRERHGLRIAVIENELNRVANGNVSITLRAVRFT